MTGARRPWSDTTLLSAHPYSHHRGTSAFSDRNASDFSRRDALVSLEMAATSAPEPAAPIRSVLLGIDVGTGSARAGSILFLPSLFIYVILGFFL